MYPLFLKLANKPCLVIGGGVIAERKTYSLLESGAKVTIISPDLTDRLKETVEKGFVKYKKRLFKKGDIKDFLLIIAATNSRTSNKQVYLEAQKKNALVNCVDDPEYCNFYVPALMTRGSLKVAISTEGKLPMLAGEIRRLFDSLFPENSGEILDELEKTRLAIIEEAGDDKEKKKKLFKEKLVPPINSLIKELKS